MRILGHIDHPHLKITVFKMDSRLSVKFENAHYEQTYKLGDDAALDSLAAVQQWVDGEFVAQVQAQFQQMHATRLAALARVFPAVESTFEEII